MAIAQTPQTAEKLRTRYKIRESMGNIVIPDAVFPVALVDDLTGGSPGDTGYPRLCLGLIDAPAVAGQSPICVIQMPDGVGKIARLTNVILNKETAGNVGLRLGESAAVPSVTPDVTKGWANQLVANAYPGQVPDMQLGGTTSAASTGSLVEQYAMEADVAQQIGMDILMGGGSWVSLTGGTHNEALEIQIRWTEYLLEDR